MLIQKMLISFKLTLSDVHFIVRQSIQDQSRSRGHGSTLLLGHAPTSHGLPVHPEGSQQQPTLA